jgi:activator of HSP90 ATPase
VATTTAAAPPDGGALIHQEIDFKASPERIYEALLDQKRFGAASGTAAQIQREAGGAFTLIGGPVTGRNVDVELIPNQRIVQAWRVAQWPSGVYSVVRFELTAKGLGTRIVFDQTGFPPDDREALTGNWSKFYWDPLRKYLDK